MWVSQTQASEPWAFVVALEYHFLCFVHLAFERQKRTVELLEINFHPLCSWGICLIVNLDCFEPLLQDVLPYAPDCPVQLGHVVNMLLHLPPAVGGSSGQWGRWCERTLKIHALKNNSAFLSLTAGCLECCASLCMGFPVSRVMDAPRGAHSSDKVST